MASSDDDEDLKLAMALSMQQTPPKITNHLTTNNAVVDLTSDSEHEDENMRRAIELSLQAPVGCDNLKHSLVKNSLPASSNLNKVTTSASPTRSTKDDASTTLSSTPRGISGLDRKAMEQERLARLGKRKRDLSPERPLKQIVKTSHPEVTHTFGITPQPSAGTNLQYPRGVIKRTAATKFPRTDDITLDEVLQADSVNIAVISSFMWDSEWLNEKLDPVKVKQIWIMNAKGHDVQLRWMREMEKAGIPNLKLHFPPMDGMIHSMHSKFMLLFGQEKLRIVIPTANMTPFDWGEVKNNWQPGVMENSAFLIDLPRRNDGIAEDTQDLTAFARELIHFLEEQRVGKKVMDGVLKHDFSQTQHLAFVHSIGGAHKGGLQHPTGLGSLAKAIRDMQLDNVEDIELDYAASSLGAINDSLLQRIYVSACGKDPMTTPTAPNVRNHIRIYFPTDEAVKKSIGGPDCGGIISLTRQYYNAATFPRECLRNYDSTRRGMLSHNKLLFGRGTKKDGKPFAWVYVGSANLSESAWGGQKVLKSGQMGSLNIRNWECGVVIPVPSEKMADMGLSDGEMAPMSVFEGTIEVPFVYPGQPYGDQQPWFFRAG